MATLHGDADLKGTGMPFVARVDDATREKARWELLAFAKEQPDQEAWARDIARALGLMRKPDRKPGHCSGCGGTLPTNPWKDVDRQHRARGLCPPCGRAEEAGS
jgi:hypothetical protein